MRALCLLLTLGGCAQKAGPPRLPIGSPCAGDDACGAGYHCATDHPDGYCEAACKRDGDCPGDAVCVGAGFLSRGDCHQSCASACRGSYVCVTGSEASRPYCDPPGRSDVARRLRGRAWRW